MAPDPPSASPPSPFPLYPTTGWIPLYLGVSTPSDTGPYWYWLWCTVKPCSGGIRRRYPPPVVPPTPFTLSEIYIPNSHPFLSLVSTPTVCGPSCGGIRPRSSQCAGTAPTSLTCITGPPVKIPRRALPESRYPLPISPTPAPDYPTSNALVIGWAPLPDNRHPPPTGLSQLTWRRRQGRGGYHRRWAQLLPLTLPPIMPFSVASDPLLVNKGLSKGAGHWGLAAVQTCRIWGIWVRVGSPPPVSQLCPTHSSEQSEPGGWYSLMPSPRHHSSDHRSPDSIFWNEIQ